MPVHSELRSDCLLLSLDNPPVNGLGHALRLQLWQALFEAETNCAVRAVVLSHRGTLFSGGADIREFNSPLAEAAPNLHDLIERLEDFPKPVVMALNGAALGGGLELSLGAHYRVATASAAVGLPEVNIGLLPGGGGTQRLPRAVGLEAALNMMLSGTPVAAAKLAGTDLFARVVEGDAIDAAIEVALSAADSGARPRLRDVRVEHSDGPAFLSFARASAVAAAPQLPAPAACVDAVAASLKPFEQGIQIEREGFYRLLATPESKALRHAFFSERAASKVPGLDAAVPTRPIHRVGVIGAGTMGIGISLNFLNAGIPVRLLETGAEALQRGVTRIRETLESAASKGRISADQLAQRLDLLQPGLDYAAFADVDLAIEAVYEDYAVKQSVFQQLDAVLPPGAILASNTSTLDLDRLAGFTSRPQDVIGLHFFSPANIMKLLEVVRGAQTAPDVLATALQLAKRIGKTAVVSGVCDGFIGNRMLEQYLRQAGFLLDEGALPQQVDAAMEAFGFAMGPFRMSDLAGGDIGWAIRKRRAVELPDIHYSKIPDLLCERGRFGQKSGAGFYDYRHGERAALPSAEVQALIEAHSASLGLNRRRIDEREIVERLLYALVDEGARILQEGIALRASDIDVVYLSGYGFPAWRGGPMHWADQVGLPKLLDAIRRFERGYQGQAWAPSELLLRLASTGGRFND
jgi:3-hydroxyacyl-CoA dehydrogenase